MTSQSPTPPEGHYAATPPRPPRERRGPFERTPFLASILSMIPGLGHVYNGLYGRALTFAFIFFGLLAVAVNSGGGPELGFIVPALVFCWFFNLIDAYRQAVLINYGYTPDGELPDSLFASARGSGGLALGAAIFLLGLFGLVQHLFPRLDLTVLFELWYVPFLLFGGWLLYRALRDRWQRAGEGSWKESPREPEAAPEAEAPTSEAA